jgi:predicted porin
VRKLLICALALGGFAASAQAADLSVDSLKDPLPEKLSFAGVTVYGTVDVGYAYQDHGYSVSNSFYTGFNYAPNTAAVLSRQSTVMNNAMSQSFVGVKVEESLGMGFVAIGKIESGFNPISGELADACKSLLENPAKSAALNAYGDGGRCGQFLNGQAYGGISNASYGTLTVGRHNSFMTDGVGAYDPNHGSYAFSMIGYSGGAAAGVGSTETSRWDNSVKYVYQFGPAHAGVMYSSGGDGTSILGDAVGANVGASYRGLSVDAYYTKENGAVNLTGANAAVNPIGFLYNISNNEAYSVMAKYTMDLGGGFKDEGPASKLTFFGGYVHIDMSNPDHAQGDYANQHTLNGYSLIAADAHAGFYTDKIVQTAWAGATYETGAWSFTGAYYHLNQNSYYAASAADLRSGGDLDQVSGVVDYKFNKHFDVYSGVSWVDYTGDWKAAGTSESVTVATGLRLKF